MDKYKIPCTEEQTKKALELGAPIVAKRKFSIDWKEGKRVPYPDVERDEKGEPILIPVTAEQMIGFILENGKGYSIDLSELIREQGYKQGCLTFIDNCLGL